MMTSTRRRFLPIVILILMMTLLFASAPFTQAQTGAGIGYEAALLRYFRTLNQRDYATGYATWLPPDRSFEQFTAGFADTDRIEPYLGFFQPDPANPVNSGRVPTVLLGYRYDGTIASYAGCIWVTYNLYGWQISESDLRLLSANGVPDVATRDRALNLNCYAAYPNLLPTFEPAVNRDAIVALSSYVRQLNARDYSGAYAQWLQPLPGVQPNGGPPADYRPDFTQFVNGFADTNAITPLFGTYQYGGAAAGKPYLDGLLPVVLVSERLDGSYAAFSGCYVMGRLPSGLLGIVDGALVPLSVSIPTGSTLTQSLANINCGALSLNL